MIRFHQLAVLFLVASAQAADPSLQAVRSVLESEDGTKSYGERWRVLADLDGDGVKDMILSTETGIFGNSGGHWTVYLNRDKDWQAVGNIHAHPRAISIEPDQNLTLKDSKSRSHARIWVYSRAGGGAGSLGYYRIGEKSVEDLQSVEIFPGDSGTNIGRRLYKAAFEESSIPMQLEFSETDETGKVRWKSVE